MRRLFRTLRIADQLPAMLRYARALTRDDAAAEDLVHDALLRAYDKRASFRPGADPRPWLFTILHNLFVTKWRKAAIEQRGLRIATELQPGEELPNQEHAVRLRSIAQAFDGLSDDHRAVLHLVVVQGLSYQEAADVLDVPLGTLISRLGRARAALRDRERLPRREGGPELRLVGKRDE